MNNELKNYEIGFLVKEEGDAMEIIKIINNYQATILNKGQIKKIYLAYPIKKETSAYFNYFIFSMLSQNIAKLNDVLKINLKILRFLIIAPTTIKIVSMPAKHIKSIKKIPSVKLAQSIKKTEPIQILSNEALEKKLEEILK